MKSALLVLVLLITLLGLTIVAKKKSNADYNTIDDRPLKDLVHDDPAEQNRYMRSNQAGTMRGEQRIDGTLIINDKSDDRILAGIQEGGFGTKDLGIKVSQTGIDVKTADDDELVMSSAFNMLKIVSTISTSQTLPNPVVAGTTYTKTYAHGLSYTPGIMAFMDDGSIAPIPRTVHAALATTPFQAQFLVSVDSTNVTFKVMTAGSSFYNGLTINYKVYLFRETAE